MEKTTGLRQLGWEDSLLVKERRQWDWEGSILVKAAIAGVGIATIWAVPVIARTRGIEWTGEVTIQRW